MRMTPAQLLQHEWAKHVTCMSSKSPPLIFAPPILFRRVCAFRHESAVGARPHRAWATCGAPLRRSIAASTSG